MAFFKSIGKALSSPIRMLAGRSGPNPAQSAMPYLDQIPGIGRQYLEPFIGQGAQAQQEINPIYQQMSQDPSAFLNALMSNYSPSEGYRFKEQELNRSLQNSAAAAGYAGTPYAQREQGELINNLLSGDMQQYLSNILGIQGRGLGGRENVAERGYQASGNLADYLGSALGQQGGLAYQGQAQQNANRMGRHNALLGLLGNLAGAGASVYGTNQLRNMGGY